MHVTRTHNRWQVTTISRGIHANCQTGFEVSIKLVQWIVIDKHIVPGIHFL